MRSIRQRTLTAATTAAQHAQKATDECKKAKSNAESTKLNTQRTEELLKEFIGDSAMNSKPLMQANEAKTYAEEAVKQCLTALQAANEAEEAAVHALLKIMENVKNITKDSVITREQQKQLYEHEQSAAKEMDNAEKETKKAEIAAQESIKAAQMAFRAQETATEIARVVQDITQKLREQGDKELTKEKIKTQAATQRAIDAEAAVRIAHEKLINEELRKKEKQIHTTDTVHQVRIHNPITESAGYAVCGHAQLMLLLMLLLPAVVFAAVP